MTCIILIVNKLHKNKNIVSEISFSLDSAKKSLYIPMLCFNFLLVTFDIQKCSLCCSKKNIISLKSEIILYLTILYLNKWNMHCLPKAQHTKCIPLIEQSCYTLLSTQWTGIKSQRYTEVNDFIDSFLHRHMRKLSTGLTE